MKWKWDASDLGTRGEDFLLEPAGEVSDALVANLMPDIVFAVRNRNA
jgi:hypothetical protein